MAKSARASVTKRNHRNLRAKVFGPAHDARLERLSAKLQELAAKPKVNEEKAMDVDDTTERLEGEEPTNDSAEEMEVDADGAKTKSTKPRSKKSQSNGKVQKMSKRKPRNLMVFASERARKAKMVSKAKRR
ncbi:uncharacterized protein PV06_02677 [Exophiala oligosperma]|uniref:DUF2423 domain-containing protein n=2 Tax=Chaetothyriales TaxID=34395 RepID=A0A0D2EGL1_9EURO|nr:uncharacterized protein PV06_02677 [Exophiala oligosperma]KAJ9623382.1 hypothetical protein H2204_011198 [Knufia peltigerae]KIW47069.1 hypothetical protein PV06_02677 [Exophiala oligosperma]